MTTERQELAKLQTQILEYMDEEGVDRVFGENGIIAKSLRTTYRYDEKELRNILEPLDKWEEVLKVDGVALRIFLPPSPLQCVKKLSRRKK